jgi:hypothetical protein
MVILVKYALLTAYQFRTRWCFAVAHRIIPGPQSRGESIYRAGCRCERLDVSITAIHVLSCFPHTSIYSAVFLWLV